MTTALPGGTAKSTVRDVCAMLGVPRRDWNTWVRWAAELRDAPRGTPSDSVVNQTLDAVHSYVDVMIAERCAHPTDDLLSELIDAEIDGMGFTTDELCLSVTTLLTMASAYEKASPRK